MDEDIIINIQANVVIDSISIKGQNLSSFLKIVWQVFRFNLIKPLQTIPEQ